MKKRSEVTAETAELLELGVALGQNHAFALVAGRCSAAQAEGLRRLREQKLYKRCTENWADFCPRYLKMSRAEADRTIQLLEEFGPAYFEVSQLTRISPETFRAIAGSIADGVLHHNGEAIELNAENSRRVAAAVAEMRRTIPAPKKPAGWTHVVRELNELCHESDLELRINKLAECCGTMVGEFERISRDERLCIARIHFRNALAGVRDEIIRLAAENDV